MASIRIERRLQQPRWLTFVVPLGSLVAAVVVMSIVLAATGHSPGHTFRRIVETAFGEQDRDQRDARLGDAAPLHRPLRGGRVPHEPLQHRRGGSAVHGRDPRRRHRARARRLAVGADDPGDGPRRRDRRRGARADPGGAPGLLLDERDHRLADAQLRRRAAADVPDLRLRVVLARHVDARREGVPPGQVPAERGELAGAARRRVRVPVRLPARGRARRRRLGALLADAVRLRGARDRRLAARRDVCRHAHAAEDPRGDGALGRAGRHRRREPGRRLPPPARPARPDRCRLRLRGDRDRGARALQPVRRRARRVPARRPAERGLRAAGRRLPLRPRRRDGGVDPLLRARRRAARALPDPRRARPSRQAAAETPA